MVSKKHCAWLREVCFENMSRHKLSIFQCQLLVEAVEELICHLALIVIPFSEKFLEKEHCDDGASSWATGPASL